MDPIVNNSNTSFRVSRSESHSTNSNRAAPGQEPPRSGVCFFSWISGLHDPLRRGMHEDLDCVHAEQGGFFSSLVESTGN